VVKVLKVYKERPAVKGLQDLKEQLVIKEFKEHRAYKD
jgi:hypothetical protein